MTSPPVWTGAGPGLVAAIRGRQARRRHAPLIELLRGRLGGELRRGAYFARHGTIDLRLRLLTSSEPMLVVSVVCRPAGRFRITRSSRLQRALGPFVPALPFATHDRDFDGRHTVQTRDLHLTGDVLDAPEVRETVARLLEGDAREVRLDGNRVKALLWERRLPEDPQARAARVLEVVEGLARIATEVDSFSAARSVSYAPRRDRALVTGWVLSGLVAAAAVGAFLAGMQTAEPVEPWPVILVPVALGLGLACVTTLGMAQLLRGRTSPICLVTTHALLHLNTLPLLTVGLAMLLNAGLDEGAATVHTPLGPLSGLVDAEDVVRLTPDQLASAMAGHALAVSTDSTGQGGSLAYEERVIRPGALGVPWIEASARVLRPWRVVDPGAPGQGPR